MIKGGKHTQKTKDAISASMKGKQNGLGSMHSIETKIAIGAGAKINWTILEFRTKMREATSGPNHWRWKGGHSNYRGPDWEQQRQLALERDEHACQRCGKTKEELNQEPDVHHKVRYNSTHDNNLDNLICLCASCHAWVEANGCQIN